MSVSFSRLTSLVLVFDSQGRVLLWMKKRGFGVGKYNGFGGKLQEWETSRASAVRELFEETSLRVVETDLQLCAQIIFSFDTHPDWNTHMDVFITQSFVGTPAESEEMTTEWYEISAVPYTDMWDADRIWMPRVLSGERDVRLVFHYDADDRVRAFETYDGACSLSVPERLL